MKENREIFQAIEEINEKGEVKAICCLMIEKRFRDMRLTSDVQRLTYMRDANVKVSLTSDFAVVNLSFDNNMNYDYLQALELCKEYTAIADACKPTKKPNSDLSLILSITPKGEEYDFFLMGKDVTWSVISEKPEGTCNTIRLVFVKKKLESYKAKNKRRTANF